MWAQEAEGLSDCSWALTLPHCQVPYKNIPACNKYSCTTSSVDTSSVDLCGRPFANLVMGWGAISTTPCNKSCAPVRRRLKHSTTCYVWRCCVHMHNVSSRGSMAMHAVGGTSMFGTRVYTICGVHIYAFGNLPCVAASTYGCLSGMIKEMWYIRPKLCCSSRYETIIVHDMNQSVIYKCHNLGGICMVNVENTACICGRAHRKLEGNPSCSSTR